MNSDPSLCTSDSEVPAGSVGPLDGKIVLRFAHAYDANGGTERYLDDLDQALLQRSSATVVRLYLTRSAAPVPAEEQRVGRGRLIRIRLPVIPVPAGADLAPAEQLGARFKRTLRDWVLYQPGLWEAFGERWTRNRVLPDLPGQAIGAGPAAEAVLREFEVDLVVLHFFGGRDADDIIRAAQTHRVPLVLLNHYSNDRYLHLAIRQHALLADAACGVNGLQVPRYLQNRFTNLSDGVDTTFLQRSSARPVPECPAGPVILLPARVIREKGALDLVRAVAKLRDAGIECTVVFAGSCPDPSFLAVLRADLAHRKLTPAARFIGAISIELLRDWYAASTVVVLPTYHHEGLSRIVIEAQAMGTPVISYATGGIPEAIVSGVTGQLIRTGDVEGLGAALRQLLGSEALRSAFSRDGRRSVEQNFSLRALAERHETLYVRVAARP